MLDDLLTAYLDEWDAAQRANRAELLACVGRGDPRVIAAMLARVDGPPPPQGRSDERFVFAHVLGRMGKAAATREVWRDVPPLLDVG